MEANLYIYLRFFNKTQKTFLVSDFFFRYSNEHLFVVVGLLIIEGGIHRNPKSQINRKPKLRYVSK